MSKIDSLNAIFVIACDSYGLNTNQIDSLIESSNIISKAIKCYDRPEQGRRLGLRRLREVDVDDLVEEWMEAEMDAEAAGTTITAAIRRVNALLVHHVRINVVTLLPRRPTCNECYFGDCYGTTYTAARGVPRQTTCTDCRHVFCAACYKRRCPACAYMRLAALDVAGGGRTGVSGRCWWLGGGGWRGGGGTGCTVPLMRRMWRWG